MIGVSATRPSRQPVATLCADTHEQTRISVDNYSPRNCKSQQLIFNAIDVESWIPNYIDQSINLSIYPFSTTSAIPYSLANELNSTTQAMRLFLSPLCTIGERGEIAMT